MQEIIFIYFSLIFVRIFMRWPNYAIHTIHATPT